MEKPFFYFGSAYLWTLMLIALTGVPFAVGLAALSGAAAIWLTVLMVRKRKQQRGKLPFFLTTAVMALLACIAFFLQTGLSYRPALALAGEGQTVRGYVSEVQADSAAGNHRCVVTVEDAGPLRKLQLSTKQYVPRVNDALELTVTPFVLGEEDPDLMAYYKARGVYLGAYVTDRVNVSELTGHPVRSLIGEVLSLRERLTGNVSEWLPDDLSSVLNAMLVGEKTHVSGETRTLFQKSGILHLFAVSGFHTSLWSMLLYKALLRLGAGRKTSCAGVLLFLLFFVTLTGFSRSAVRAGIMLGLFFLGRMFLRTSEPLNALGLAVFLILLPNPFYGGDTGLLLSYFATLGILSLYPPMAKPVNAWLLRKVPNRSVRRRVQDLSAVALITLSTMVATLPVVTLSFENISLVAMGANLLVSAVSSLSILSTGLGSLFSLLPVLRLLSPWCYLVSAAGARYTLAVCEKLASLPFAYVNLTGKGFTLGLTAAMLVAVAGFVLYGLLPDGGMVRVTALLSAIVLLSSVLCADLLNRNVVKVSFADVSGTCILVTYRGEGSVIGCGGSDYEVTSAVEEVFEREGVSRFSTLIVPRNKATEAGALKALTEAREPVTLLKPDAFSDLQRRTLRLLPSVTLQLYLQNGDCCAGLLTAEGVRFLLLFRPTVDLAGLPAEARSAPVVFVRGNPPEDLKYGASSYIIVSGESGSVEACVKDGRLRLSRR